MRHSHILLVFLAGVTLSLAAFYVRDELAAPGLAAGFVVEIPRGLSARGVVDLLAEKNIVRNRHVTIAYLLYTRTYNRLQAGEYLFERPLTIPEVVDKIAKGAVFLHKFTVPEGLTVKETALKWEEQAFGKAEEFLQAAAGAVDLVKTLNEKAVSVEGYLFPETYSFPARTTPRQAIAAMLDRFRETVDRLKRAVPPSSWPRNLHDTTIVASLV